MKKAVSQKGMGFYEDYLKGVNAAYGPNGRFKNQAELARFVELAPAQVKKYTSRDGTKNLAKLGSFLDKIGARLEFTHKQDSAREVCFVDAKVVPAGEQQTAPIPPEDYLAVPLVEEVGAGPGIYPEGKILSWFLVYRHQEAVRFRKDLIAVQLGQHSTSMLPTLSPGDIVLVDRADKIVSHPGRIMLVMDPDGAGKIKRVATDRLHNDYRITYYSDNVADNPPEVYSLRDDFLGDWERSIAGRVVWAWSDVSNK